MFVSTFLRVLQFHLKLLRGEGSRSSSSLNHGMFQTGCRLKLPAQSWLSNDHVFSKSFTECDAGSIGIFLVSILAHHLYIFTWLQVPHLIPIWAAIWFPIPPKESKTTHVEEILFFGGFLGFWYIILFRSLPPMQVDSHRQPLRCVSLVDGHPVGGTEKSIQNATSTGSTEALRKGWGFWRIYSKHTRNTKPLPCFFGEGRLGSHKIYLSSGGNCPFTWIVELPFRKHVKVKVNGEVKIHQKLVAYHIFVYTSLKTNMTLEKHHF